MRFTIVDRFISPGEEPVDTVVLFRSSWDDWFKYETSFFAEYFDSGSVRHEIGQLKIGEAGLRGKTKEEYREDPEVGTRRPTIPQTFSRLSDLQFSLGQDESYYSNLENIGERFRVTFLKALKDISYEPRLLRQHINEPVLSVSLLRSVPILTVENQFHRLAHGNLKLTEFNIEYVHRVEKGDPLTLTFSVVPESHPPSNIHVIVGRNGVGKTTLLDGMARSMIDSGKSGAKEVSNIVTVSFSAFDSMDPIQTRVDRTKGPTYRYVGLKKTSKVQPGESMIKDHSGLSRDMTESAKVCLSGARASRWIRALRLLENDPMFRESGLSDLATRGEDVLLPELPKIFKRLSSGHKIVLLTITRLVETVVERTLVLLDEPETHLHPPLLSALVLALSDLLVNRNGLAVVATHSPVVLQEVPRACVWRLDRQGYFMSASRPSIETFAENVGTLTSEVFGLEVLGTGYQKLLTEVAYETASYREALDKFSGNVGIEGRAILRSRQMERNVV